MIFNWQDTEFEGLLARRGQLPHALLLHGQNGIGKSTLAQFFAQSLLCEQPQANGHACGECSGCRWFGQGSHPDFRRVRPEALDDAAETDGDADEGKDKKKASQEIRIDQIRALADFMNLATHRSGLRIVLLYPAQALNLNAANALLKMLEEPPPNSLFLLVSDGLDRLLPTILSRCQKVALSVPDPAQALAWLKQQGVKEAEALLHEAGGAPLRALELSATPELRQSQTELFQSLANPAQLDALRLAEKLYKLPLPTVIDWMQRWLYDLVACCQAGRVRYYPGQQTAQAGLAGQIPVQAAVGLARQVTQFQAIAAHPLNARVQLEALFLQYQRTFAQNSAQKQGGPQR